MRTSFLALLCLCAFSFTAYSQRPSKPSSAQIYESIKKLNFLGSALYVAAHPDDENTRLISYLSNDLYARTAYLSMTRGDGGQNLIGPEIRELLGVIRTQELVGARSVDGGSQYFTRANDFGYSKHPDETLKIWNKTEVLKDVVMNIRRFKPDIIINRFNHRTPGSTHGHHTSSAMLGVAAFDLVGDAGQYPESAMDYGIWQPKRLFFNTGWWFYGSRENFAKADKSGIIEVETGSYYKTLGLSNGEIASLSRSMHKSQGFGSSGTRGSQLEYLEFLKGDALNDNSDLFEGINTTWSRLEGGEAVGAILEKVESQFDFANPSASVPGLLEAYNTLSKLPESHWKTLKNQELVDIIVACSGLYLEAAADRQATTPNGEVKVSLEMVNRSSLDIRLNGVAATAIQFPQQLMATPLKENQKVTWESVPGTFSISQFTVPYWLNDQGSLGMYHVDRKDYIGLPTVPKMFPINFMVSIEGTQINVYRNIIYKFTDPVKGEVYQPFDVLPEITTAIKEKVTIFSNGSSKEIPVTVRAGKDNVSGTLTMSLPAGWTATPAATEFRLDNQGESKTFMIRVTPPTSQSEGYLQPKVIVEGKAYEKELIAIDYDHIPYQNVLMTSKAKVVKIDIEKNGTRIAYVNGAGDAIPESLRQIGYEVIALEPDQLNETELSQFDALVFGIRAFNILDELQFKKAQIDNFVAKGGNVLVQYNTSHSLVTQDFSPYPIKLSRQRVTDEAAEVRILKANHAVLNTPNKITKADFKGWVQERGLYFPSEWDDKYDAILSMNDPGADPSDGSLLVASHGEGHYIYTGISFFRELPAGVPGAYRLFANLLSIGK
ncbi:MAG: PIG-L family deacetylase [Gilvibacter sp.]